MKKKKSRFLPRILMVATLGLLIYGAVQFIRCWNQLEALAIGPETIAVAVSLIQPAIIVSVIPTPTLIRFCSASATFFADWNDPRSAIDHERSTISTVVVVVTISVR